MNRDQQSMGGRKEYENMKGYEEGIQDERERIRKIITGMIHERCIRDDDDCLWNDALIELRAKLENDING